MPGAARGRSSPLPGFGLSLGITILWLSLIVLIPLSAVFVKSLSEGWATFWAAAVSPRALAAYRLSFGAAALAAVVNCLFGLLVAWVLVRYRFPGRRLLERADRSAVRAADRGRRHRADRALRRHRLASAGCWSRSGMHDRLHAARRRRRADLHRPAVRGSDRGAGAGRRLERDGGSRADPRRARLQTFCRVILPTIAPALPPASRSPSRAASANMARSSSSPATCRSSRRSRRC